MVMNYFPPMPFFARNVELGKPLRLSNWRKAAFGMWRTAADPSTYGILDIDAGPALAYIEKLRKLTGLKVTMSHFAGRAVAEVVARHRDINCVYRWGRLYSRKQVDIFFQVASDEEGKDLSGMTIRNTDRKSVVEIAQEMRDRAVLIREKGDQDHRKMKKTLGSAPGLFSGLILRIVGFFAYTLNIWTPLFGLPRDAFGSVMVSSVGSMGLDIAFAPLVAYSRTPMLVAVGAVRKEAVVREGDRIEVAPMIKICVTFDHRVMDGKHASHMSKTLHQVFANPEAELECRAKSTGAANPSATPPSTDAHL